MKDIYTTEVELRRANFNLREIIRLEKNRAIAQSNCDYIIFNCGETFFNNLYNHPSSWNYTKQKECQPLFINRNYLNEYKRDPSKIKDFLVVSDILFLLEFNSNINHEEAMFESENYISVLRDIYYKE